MPLMYLPIPERACGIEYNCLSRRETDAHWLPAHDGLRQTTQEGCWWAHKGWVGADSSGIFVGCVWKRDRSSEKKEIASILKKGLLFIFFEEAPLGTERIKKIANTSDEIRGREESFPAHVVCAQPRSANFKFLRGKM